MTITIKLINGEEIKLDAKENDWEGIKIDLDNHKYTEINSGKYYSPHENTAANRMGIRAFKEFNEPRLIPISSIVDISKTKI